MLIAIKFLSGRISNIYLLFRSDQSAADDYILGLSKDTQPKVMRLFQHIADGHMLNDCKFKRLTGSIYEFKPYGHRILCFKTNRGFVLTGGFPKSTAKKTTQREIRQAQDLQKEFEAEGRFDD